MGVKLGSNTLNAVTVGPQLVTQDFATASGATPFVTGVAYYDLNANNFYDPGEGIGGVTVSVEGSSYYAVTANSGGYSVPVPNADATRNVTFSGTALSQSANATISGLRNVKTDFVPAYSPPVVTGPATIYTGSSTDFTFSPVGGAAHYGWQYAEKLPSAPENCENLSNVTTSTTAGYNVVDTAVKDSGSSSFHLAHPAFTPQTITLQKTYFPQAGSTLHFKSRVGYATTVQTARVQVAREGSSNWADVYTQNGTGAPGESGFTTKIVPLSDFVGQLIQIRFAYTVTNSAYTGTSPEYGWHIDTVTFENTSELAGTTTVEPVGSPAFSFSPPKTGTFLLSARPNISGRYWSFGPITEINAQSPIGYAEWVASLNPTVIEGPTGDHDRDGLSNLVEYAFGSNPNTPTASSALPQPSIQGNQWQVSYTAPASITGITYGAEWSTDLVSWTPLADSGSGHMHTFSVSMAGRTKIFFRHKTTLLP